MKSLLRLLSIEEAIKLKFGFFKKGDSDFSFEQLKEHCVCGADMVCVCQRKDDSVHEYVEGVHLCLNSKCHLLEKGDRQRIKSVKRGPIEQCPVCWRELD
jgi:hypothetical protein